ncbi:NAD(P)H-binding protein [Flagellimonas olearia]|uniref:NAD(P)H-binding protein n=1 Tax=Flagellimonas olearia TaxID=552546 RepID=A0A6I1DXM1_9FLAO|nr:NAD(P)H-binding protein [Allomuricauda olearia]KAB7528102.1 NAD(P)H-binding protein [Allomuricauda olearia]
MTSNILVLGGKGKTGRKVVEQLINQKQNVRVGSRSEAIPFDWENRATWPNALDGMDKVYITFQPDLAVPGALKAIEELVKVAQQKNVKKLVLLSGKGEREAELCEQVVIHSGIDYTIVRASWFNQNFSESFFLDPILAGHVALPMAQAKIPFVDTDDIADVVVEVLMNDGHDGKTYELTGARFLTFEEVVADIAKATGRDIAFTPISLPAYTKMMEEVGVPSDYVWLINYLFSEVLGNKENEVIAHDIEKVLGRAPKDFSEYVQETAATGIWNPTV